MTGEQHALKILNAIQAAEADGFQVVIGDGLQLVIGGGVRELGACYRLTEPTFEDGVWELETDD